MRLLLITVGSRGDVEPFCALADALVSRDHQVDLFLQTDLKHLAISCRGAAADAAARSGGGGGSIDIHELPFTQNDFYRFVSNPTHGGDHPNPRVKFTGIVADVIGELVMPCCEEVMDVASNNSAEVIITSSLGRPVAVAVSEKLDIPLCIIHLQPLAPTTIFPHYSNQDDCVKAMLRAQNVEDSSVGSDENIDSYWALEGYHHDFLKERLDKMRSCLGLSSLTFDDKVRRSLSGYDDRVWIANAFSTPEVVPPCWDAGPNIFEVGPLADAFIPSGWKASDELISFLEKECDKPPVCIGYGSMPFDKVSVVLEALREVGEKAVLVGDNLKVDDDDEWAEENVIHVTSAPYAWLLPKCSMMLCHGGAGVVNATLRAGIPIVISPLIGDQSFWAQLLEAIGVGVRAGSILSAVTVRDLVKGMTLARSCTNAARKLGDQIRAKKLGVDTMVEILEAKTLND